MPRNASATTTPLQHGQMAQSMDEGIHSYARQSNLNCGPESILEHGYVQRKRVYMKNTRAPSRRPLQRKIRVDRLEKVSLNHVRMWTIQSKCVKQCFKEISETEIMDVRYEVWVNQRTCDE
jgi:hypothetical protein